MPRKNSNIVQMIMLLPWWMSILIAIVMYLVLLIGITLIIVGTEFSPENPEENLIKLNFFNGLIIYFWVFPLIFLVIGLISFFRQKIKKNNFETFVNGLKKSVEPLDYVRSLSFEDYKSIVSNFYKNKGYCIKESYLVNKDGGFSLCLEKNRLFHFVWCTHWHLRVTEPSLERMYKEFMNEENAIKMTVITTGEFTNDAKKFAVRDNSIELVDGNLLIEMIKGIKNNQEIRKG